MAGPAKKRAQAEKKSNGSSEEHKSSRDSGREETPQRSTPKSLPRLDGNRDPQTRDLATLSRNPADYANLRNISDALGMAGWYIARGVSP
jgi:eukaryotic translation initiation factor 2C